MIKYKVTLLQVARDDIGEIFIYIAADNPESALEISEKIIEKIDLLAEFPYAGKIVPDSALAKQEYRMLTVSNYIIFYKVIDNEVIVYRILHGMRDYPGLFNGPL
ncbi:type II toxin-antitoxin system RelE/ParE family toxin [Desulfitobacterium chlororespirans]|uniref:Addiction module toxin, RelE/StbE family n=1 Tax=Desulfitobacterium chlororespirans DSM 11544 TaxID=1121395 RepID=A0A1M7TQD2_9FIRM|nr:type II toxin-antitoxin system RelE/ParE family toxin [Desulfitobacterium chlororespirans]SHN72949.1 addiction module toxin, RelE/StbE family [Desulfitobacterium chlororespirans DSM 11544]